jgi:hypothetical protein
MEAYLMNPIERKTLQQERAAEGAKAMVDYLAAEEALRKKTARLRAERLAREGIPVEVAPPAPKKQRASRAKKAA